MKFVPLPIATLENNKIFLWKKWTLKNVAKFEVRLCRKCIDEGKML